MAAGLCMSCPEKRVDKFRCQRCKDANIARARRRVKGTVQFLRKYLAVQFPATIGHLPLEEILKEIERVAYAKARRRRDDAGGGDGWMVKYEDWKRLADASACKDRLPPGHFAKLDEEYSAVRAIFSPNASGADFIS